MNKIRYIRYFIGIRLIRFGYHCFPNGKAKALLAFYLKTYYNEAKYLRYEI